MKAPTVTQLLRTMEAMGYIVFHDERGHDLNIVGIRADDPLSNKFNDLVTVSYWFDGEWNYFAFPATTDPGIYWRENLMNVDGTAIVKPGQYRRSHKLGNHKGQSALVQASPITVLRDANRDDVLDVRGVPETTGMFGIDIHRSNHDKASIQVDRWSAGCQVLQDPDHFEFFLALCRRSAMKYGNAFTYTLITESSLI